MTHEPKIFYYLSGSEHPAAVKTVLEHIDFLTRYDRDAAVLLGPRDTAETDPKLGDARVCRLEGMGLCPGDTIITPDGAPLPEAADIGTVRAGTLIINPLMIFQNTAAEDWDAPPFEFTLCTSRAGADFAQDVLGISAPRVIPNIVDPAVFSPSTKRSLIACTGEASTDTRFVKNSFLRRNTQHRDMEWADLDPMTEPEIAHTLSEAAIFLHTPADGASRISPLEAMACGCLVVGFRTFAAEDYAGAGNGLWCRDNELLECAQLLEPAAALTKSGHTTLERLIDSGRETAASHSPRAVERVFRKTFQELDFI